MTLRRLVVVVALVAAVPGAGTEPASGSTDAIVTVDRPTWAPTEGPYEGPGDRLAFSVWEDDLPDFAQVLTVRVSSTSDPVGIFVRAERYARYDNYFYGSAGFTMGPSDDGADRVHVADGDEVTVSYLDLADASGTPRTASDSQAWVFRTRLPDYRELVYVNLGTDSSEVVGWPEAAVAGATVRVLALGAETVLGTGTVAADGSFRVPFASAADHVRLEMQEPDVPASRRLTVRRALAYGKVAAPETGDPGIRHVLVGWAPEGDCGRPDCGIHPITNKAGYYDAHSDSIPAAGRYVLHTHLQGGLVIDRETKYFAGTAYGNVGGVVVDVPAQPAPTVLVPTIRVKPPNLFGVSRDEQGGIVPDIEVWAEDDRGEELSFMRARGFGTEAGDYGVHLADGNYHVEPRAPRGCLSMSTPPFDVTVVDGVADPSEHDLLWTTHGSAITTPVTGGVPDLDGDPVQIDLGTPGGPVSVTIEGADGAGSVTAACRPDGLDTPTLDTPVELDVNVPGVDRAQVCLPYTDARAAASGVPEADLVVLHGPDGGGVEVLPTVVDVVENVACGTTTSFSSFAVGARPSAAVTTTTPGPAPAPAAAPTQDGYWMVSAAGAVYAFGDAAYAGGAATSTAVDLERTPSGQGYWIVDRAGRVFAFGDAVWRGGAGTGTPLAAGEEVSSLSRTADGQGYWLFTTTGRALPFGSARWFGDMGGVRLNGPVLDSIPTPSGNGYYMVAADGGIFAFGDARFAGSMGNARLNAPVQSLVPDLDGAGYWLVASDGGVFAFGAGFRGSMGASRLNRPVVGMVPFGNGYLMVGEDGGIFNFSDRPFL